jgi:hypothetical protein
MISSSAVLPAGASKASIRAHNGVFNEILAARFALQDRQLLQDDNALF